ncbi:actin cytoskeleton organization protein [Rhodotorula sp. JG-1b]|nr:actin cytoskeleton organization protein [Rhodotorula sp. JG-1b]
MNEAISLVRAFYASRRTTLSPTDLRSIGPTCTALEAFNPKRALLLSDQLLKRSPANPSALATEFNQALKALAHCLTATQPVPESVKNDIVKVVQTAKSANNGAALDDADVIMLLTWALRYIDQTEEALGLMAQAVQSNPDNEELAMDAFIQYLRVNDQKAAQQISMKMAKQFKVDRYMWWSILTTILLLRDLTHPQASLLLSLAERQLVAHYTTGRKEPATAYETADEFHLITRLLELRAQYAAAAATATVASSATPSTSTLVLPSLPTSPDQPRTAARALLDHLASSEADKRCAENLGFELWRREIELEYGSVQGGEWKRLWDRLALGLKQNGDTNWHTMLYLIRAACAMAAATATASRPNEDGIALLQETRSLLRELATDSPKAQVERGYLLGVLELARELRERRWPEVDKLTELVGEYFERFGTKACCFDDLRPYIDIFSPEELQDLGALLKTATQTGLGDVRITTKAINAHKLLRRYSPQATAEEEHQNALDFTKLYFDALPLGKDLPPTELQPADDFALLAGQAWVSAFEQLAQTGTRHYLEHALALFDHVLLKSKYKYQIRILAINLLRLLGAPPLSVAHYRVFGVKNVQFDTLSHLMVARGSTFVITGSKEAGVFGETVSAMGWHSSGQTEAREMVVRAFTNEAYQKVEDFFEFKQHLQLSLQQSLITVEALRMSLLKGTMDATEPELSARRLDQMVATAPGSFADHRDFKTLPNYQSRASSPIWEQSHLGQQLNDDWLRAMALTYSRLLHPASSPQMSMSAPPSFTEDESWLFDFSAKARGALLSSLDEAPEADKALLDHFQDRAEKFSARADDEAALPWQVLQSATISLEAFLLLEIGIERRAEEMAQARGPDQAKQAKRMRTLRNSVRDLVKPIGPKVTAYGKRIPKERSKVVASLSDLSRFEQFDENRLTNFATVLIDSRRSVTDALGAAYHRRTAK